MAIKLVSGSLSKGLEDQFFEEGQCLLVSTMDSPKGPVQRMSKIPV